MIPNPTVSLCSILPVKTLGFNGKMPAQRFQNIQIYSSIIRRNDPDPKVKRFNFMVIWNLWILVLHLVGHMPGFLSYSFDFQCSKIYKFQEFEEISVTSNNWSFLAGNGSKSRTFFGVQNNICCTTFQEGYPTIF